MEGVVENVGEFTNYIVNKHFDSGWDRARKYSNGKKVEDVYRPVKVPRSLRPESQAPRSKQASTHSSSSSAGEHRTGLRSASQGQKSRVRSSDFDRGGTAVGRSTQLVAVRNSQVATFPASRKQQAALLAPATRGTFADDCDTTELIRTQEAHHQRVLEEYEDEPDDPTRNPASVLPDKDLWTLQKYEKSTKQLSSAGSRRDSGMTSGYNDDYRGNTQYQAETRSRSAQPPPRSRYYDDDDSDYDERTGRKYDGGGRGYGDRDDRDYDRYVETTERYRGPPVDRRGPDRRESYGRSEYAESYAAGAVARRSDPNLNRSQVSRRPQSSRGRDRDRSYSRSPSRSRSRSRSKDKGIQERITSQFDTSSRGLGVGLAGAVAGGLAGRQFGQKHRQRDIIIGAVVGGLLANAGENRWSEYQEEKKRDQEGMRYDGRSRSQGR
ncbi:hypothetical protein Slin14017_G022250 [Septoria linicola]|nr:hypothetical protein Slin14017_G022250 [Septoria linicola]